MKDKKKIEQEIFEYLDKDCREYSSPMPNLLMDSYGGSEILGFMSWLISKVFQDMRDTKGKSNWEYDVKVLVGDKFLQKKITMNMLRKLLMECQGEDLIEYSKEIGDEIRVKINVMKLYAELVK